MNRIYYLFLLLISTASFGQKIEEDKIDDFEGRREITTTVVNLKGSFLGYSAYGRAMIKGSDTLMSITLYFKTPSVTSIRPETKIQFKLTNDSLMTVNHLGSYKIYSSNDLGYVFFRIDDEISQTLKTYGVTKYRIHTSDSYIDVDVKESNQWKFKEIIVLLEEQMRKPAKAK